MEGVKDTRPSSGSRQRPGSGKDRPESASRARTDSMTTIEVRVLHFSVKWFISRGAGSEWNDATSRQKHATNAKRGKTRVKSRDNVVSGLGLHVTWLQHVLLWSTLHEFSCVLLSKRKAKSTCEFDAQFLEELIESDTNIQRSSNDPTKKKNKFSRALFSVAGQKEELWQAAIDNEEKKLELLGQYQDGSGKWRRVLATFAVRHYQECEGRSLLFVTRVKASPETERGPRVYMFYAPYIR